MNEQQRQETGAPGVARAVVTPQKSISIVWIVPLVALLIGGWLAYRAITEKGPTITITFQSAEGLEAGKTRIKFKDVEVGRVEEIRLTPDLSQVMVTAQLTKDAKDYLSENTRFWVVRARVVGGGVSGLGTLFSGAYIGMDPGKPGKETRSFKGLETPPIVTTDLPGRHFMLKAERLGSLDIGKPVYFRQIQVGQVVAYEMEKDGQSVDIKIFIHAPHHEHVRSNTRFWNAGGLDVSVDAGGIKVNTESFVTLMIGGIAFETPMDPDPGPAAREDEIFRLYDRREDIYKKTYVKKTRWLLRFQGSVGGLSVGAPVKFKGIRIGEVIDINLEFDHDAMAFRIPVAIEIEPERIAWTGRETIARERRTEILVEKGLRAQLKQGNLLTGQLYIDVDMYPDDPPRKIVYGGKYPEIPTIPTPIEEITRGITRIVDRLEKLPLEEIGKDLRETLAHLNKSTEQLVKLMQNLDKTLVPEATDTLERSQTTLMKLDRLLSAESPTGHELKRVLTELADAARNISVLADYLGRHPEPWFLERKRTMKNRAGFGNMGRVFSLMVFLLASCSTTPAVRYYTLNPFSEMQPDSSQSVSGDTLAIGVGPVEFPRFLDRPQIVTRKSQNRVQVSEFHRWAGSFSEDFLRVLAKNISMLLPADRVAAYPWTDRFSPTYRILLKVEQFEGQLGDHVVLNVTWSVWHQKDADEPVMKHTRIQEPISAETYDALVAAQSRAIATLSRTIVDEIERVSNSE